MMHQTGHQQAGHPAGKEEHRNRQGGQGHGEGRLLGQGVEIHGMIVEAEAAGEGQHHQNAHHDLPAVVGAGLCGVGCGHG